ncbi:conserved hypothetical protein [Ricinus communis]|uniref:Uncharacterized protein n=1 Tax=Ricinus communis TaxID=3988 RepID=B9RZG8_RICCO|nr:conserved hypothetical protein [Ricinus communis]
MAAQKEMGSDARPSQRSISPLDRPSPGFFKIFNLQNWETLKDRMIPIKFVRNCFDAFSHDVNLIVPNGHSWKDSPLLKCAYFNPSGCEYHYPSIATTQEPKEDHGCSIDPEDGIGGLALCSLNKHTAKKRKCSKMPTSSEKNQETTKGSKNVASPVSPIQENLKTTKQHEAEGAKNVNGGIGFRKTYLRNERTIDA